MNGHEQPAEFGQPRILHPPDQQGLVALFKPSGLSVDPAAEHSRSLTQWLRDQPGLPPDLVLLHRLDRETSGVVLCCTAGPRQRQIASWLAEHAVLKCYLALVHGRSRRKGIIRRKLQDRRRKRSVEAVTRYRTLEWLDRVSLVEARPETGRKHQIRRHLSGIGHPLVGDRRYRSGRGREPSGSPPRLWLHARSITLPDGWAVEADLPPELQQHLDQLRAGPGLDD